MSARERGCGQKSARLMQPLCEPPIGTILLLGSRLPRGRRALRERGDNLRVFAWGGCNAGW